MPLDTTGVVIVTAIAAGGAGLLIGFVIGLYRMAWAVKNGLYK